MMLRDRVLSNPVYPEHLRPKDYWFEGILDSQGNIDLRYGWTRVTVEGMPKLEGSAVRVPVRVAPDAGSGVKPEHDVWTWRRNTVLSDPTYRPVRRQR
jgi:hypothetical protein